MFTVLWKITPDNEEIYQSPSVVKVPDAGRRSDELDCRGRPHLAFQALEPVSDDSAAMRLVRRVIDSGEVFVMNPEGKTIAMYRLDRDDRQSLAA